MADPATVAEATRSTTPKDAKARRERIAALNDAVRTNIGKPDRPGRVVVTHGIRELDFEDMRRIVEAVRTYAAWDKGDDPYGERDFGAVYRVETEVDGSTEVSWTGMEPEDPEHRPFAFFKTAYYAAGSDYALGSEDPADPVLTDRVLTIMLAGEY